MLLSKAFIQAIHVFVSMCEPTIFCVALCSTTEPQEHSTLCNDWTKSVYMIFTMILHGFVRYAVAWMRLPALMETVCLEAQVMPNEKSSWK